MAQSDLVRLNGGIRWHGIGGPTYSKWNNQGRRLKASRFLRVGGVGDMCVALGAERKPRVRNPHKEVIREVR